MRREERLTGRRRFAEVYGEGKTWANKLVVLKVLPNGLEVNRYGFAVGKRLGNAVLRNRIKRLLREGARLIPVQRGWDVVFIAREAAVFADFHRLKEAEAELLKRARLLGNEG